MTFNPSDFVAEVKKFAGDQYVYGAAGPSTFDCSGLVQYAAEKMGLKNVPRTSEEQWKWVTHIDKSQLQPGDLVFGQFPGDNAPPGHVGVYVGNGQILAAADPAQGVSYSSLDSWGNAVYGYGRIPGDSGGTQSATLTGLSIPGFSFPGQITGFFSEADTFVNSLMWIVNPSSWLRIGAFLVGIALLLFAIHALIAVNSGSPIISMPNVVPVPV